METIALSNQGVTQIHLVHLVITCHIYLCVSLDLCSQTYFSCSWEYCVKIWCMDSWLEQYVYFVALCRLWAWCNRITHAINYYATFKLVFKKYIITIILDKPWWHGTTDGDELFITIGSNDAPMVLSSLSSPDYIVRRTSGDDLLSLPDQMMHRRWWALYHHRVIHQTDGDDFFITARLYARPTVMCTSSTLDHDRTAMMSTLCSLDRW